MFRNNQAHGPLVSHEGLEGLENRMAIACATNIMRSSLLLRHDVHRVRTRMVFLLGLSDPRNPRLAKLGDLVRARIGHTVSASPLLLQASHAPHALPATHAQQVSEFLKCPQAP